MFWTDTLHHTHDSGTEFFPHNWKKRKVKLLGHILRSSPLDPVSQVLFDYNSFTPRSEYRRPGKPRLSWRQETFKAAFGMLGRNDQYDPDNGERYNFYHPTNSEQTW